MSDELLPCPCCGSVHVCKDSTYSDWCEISCPTCGLEIGEKQEADAIANWNRRTPSMPTQRNYAEAFAALREIAGSEMDKITDVNAWVDEIRGNAPSIPIDVLATMRAALVFRRKALRRYAKTVERHGIAGTVYHAHVAAIDAALAWLDAREPTP